MYTTNKDTPNLLGGYRYTMLYNILTKNGFYGYTKNFKCQLVEKIWHIGHEHTFFAYVRILYATFRVHYRRF